MSGLFLFVDAGEILLQCSHHGRRLWLRGFDLQGQAGIFRGLEGIVAKYPDDRTVLLELGEIIEQAPDAAGRKETDDVKFLLVKYGLHIIADGAVHEGGGKFALVVLEPVHDLVVLLVLGTGVEELFVLLVLVDDIKHAFVGAIGAVKNLPFPVQDELLEVEGHCFGYAEIFGILRHADLHFLAGAEEMVDGVAAGEDNSGKILDLNLLLTEFLGWNGLQPDERKELHFDLIFPGQLKVRRLFGLGPWLGYQDFFNSVSGGYTRFIIPVCNHIKAG
jgi:hypothetical protein